MDREPEALLQQVVGGRWRLREVLGATEHGSAFVGETLEGSARVRVELWDQRHVENRGELARFERQARTLSRLRHERCLSLVAFGVHEGRPFVVTELPEGTSLRDELGKPELTLARALSLGLQLCEGLRHLHGHGVVHRALLPENVWISAGALKIGVPLMGIAAAGSDHHADLQAAGRLLYALCTGREPPQEVTTKTATRAAAPKPRAVSPERGISEGLERVIVRAMVPPAQGRFETADELLAALESVGATPTTPTRPARRASQRTAIGAAAATVVVLIVVAGLLRGGGPEESSAPPAAPPTQTGTVPAEPTVAPPPPPPPATEPKREPAPVPAPAAPPKAATPKPSEPPQDDHGEIWSLLDRGQVEEAGARIKQLVFKDPEAAWPRFAFGAYYARKRWRGDAVKHWQLALAKDPAIADDPQFGAYLCFMLDDAWRAAGMPALLEQLGAKAVPLLERCVASAKTPRLRAQASRALDELRSPR